MIKKALNKSKALSTLKKLENPEVSFEEFQSHLGVIAKYLPKSNKEFREKLSEVKNNHYRTQVATLDEAEIDEKIEKFLAMAETYKALSLKAYKDADLGQEYEKLSMSLSDDKIYHEIIAYIDNVDFNEYSVPYIEKIIAHADDIGADGVKIKDHMIQKLQTFAFGSSLDMFLFVRSLNADKLGEIYEYCIERQNALFEDTNAMIASEIIDYLLQNGEEEKVYSYIENLTYSVHLQELNYKYFNQTDDNVLDFAFIANKTEINSDYKTYILNKITDNWTNKEYLQDIIVRKNVADFAGHDEIRKVIERVDKMNAEYDAKAILEEALQTAKNAQVIALEAKEIAEGKAKIKKDITPSNDVSSKID
jgi:hypothetical protein